MQPKYKRWTGLALIVSAMLWFGGVQMLILSVPTAVASEAPLRHFPDRETLTRAESFDLSFAVASEISEGIPNVLLPALLLVWGSAWFFGSRSAQAKVE